MTKYGSKFSIGVLALWSQTQATFAQSTPGLSRGDYYHGPGMMWGEFGGFGMFLGSLFFILLLLVIVIGAIFLVRTFGGNYMGPSSGQQSNNSLNILKERYARGEIDSKEFSERKQHLSD